MTLNPPPEIRGDLSGNDKANKAARVARSRWIASLPDDIHPRQIANALGVSVSVVNDACPGRAGQITKTPASLIPVKYRVSLPEAPTAPPVRDETAPRAGIRSPQKPAPLTPADVIEIIRRECIAARNAEART